MRAWGIAAMALALSSTALAQGPPAGRAGGAVTPAQSSAPIDLTGYWVAFISEEWRYRMLTPAKGDYGGMGGVPMTPQARKIADAWDPRRDEAAGEQCKAYGAAAIMRTPARFHITWQDENTLRVDSDAGMQSRIFHFDAIAAVATGERTWQGVSNARWDRSSLKVITTNVRSGYLRRNGVPYSQNATVTEYFDFASSPGGPWLLVTTVVEDPEYLRAPFVVSSQFKKEPNGSKWDPTPCTTR